MVLPNIIADIFHLMSISLRCKAKILRIRKKK